MIQFSLSALKDPLDARQIGADASFSAVSTDTRTLARGELFVALKGPNFDGHDYLESARDRGVAGAIVSREPPVEVASLLVPDTRIALGKLAALWRQRSGAKLVAITGSNGKTTVKEMVASILRHRGTVLATKGNFNNDIGLPLTLLKLQDQDFGVVEMGANHSGEIDLLSRIACPDVALLNNAGRAHLEGFGDLEGVARAKGEILAGLRPGGCFVYNADDRWAGLWKTLAGDHKTLSFGVGSGADVSSPRQGLALEWSDSGFLSRFLVQTPVGNTEIKLSLAGEHNRMNALGAIAAALAAGVDLEEIKEGLVELKPVRGRLEPLSGDGGIGLIDDSYNANPDSVMAAIDVLATAPGRRVLVLGELAEMGEGGAGYYHDIGRYAKASGIEMVFALGAARLVLPEFGGGGFGDAAREQLVVNLKRHLRAGDRVLIKGSRSAAMEYVIDALGGRRTD